MHAEIKARPWMESEPEVGICLFCSLHLVFTQQSYQGGLLFLIAAMSVVYLPLCVWIFHCVDVSICVMFSYHLMF